MTAVAVVTAIPSNTRLSYAELMKKKASARTATNADSHMAAMSSLPRKMMRIRRESAMGFGTMDAAVTEEDASSDMKRGVGKTQPASWALKRSAWAKKGKANARSS